MTGEREKEFVKELRHVGGKSSKRELKGQVSGREINYGQLLA